LQRRRTEPASGPTWGIIQNGVGTIPPSTDGTNADDDHRNATEASPASKPATWCTVHYHQVHHSTSVTIRDKQQNNSIRKCHCHAWGRWTTAILSVSVTVAHEDTLAVAACLLRLGATAHLRSSRTPRHINTGQHWHSNSRRHLSCTVVAAERRLAGTPWGKQLSRLDPQQGLRVAAVPQYQLCSVRYSKTVTTPRTPAAYSRHTWVATAAKARPRYRSGLQELAAPGLEKLRTCAVVHSGNVGDRRRDHSLPLLSAFILPFFPHSSNPLRLHPSWDTGGGGKGEKVLRDRDLFSSPWNRALSLWPTGIGTNIRGLNMKFQSRHLRAKNNKPIDIR